MPWHWQPQPHHVHQTAHKSQLARTLLSPNCTTGKAFYTQRRHPSRPAHLAILVGLKRGRWRTTCHDDHGCPTLSLMEDQASGHAAELPERAVTLSDDGSCSRRRLHQSRCAAVRGGRTGQSGSLQNGRFLGFGIVPAAPAPAGSFSELSMFHITCTSWYPQVCTSW